MVTDLKSDILENEIKGALGSIANNKHNGGDRIPAALFKPLKDDAIFKMPAHLENSTVIIRFEKIGLCLNPKNMFKLISKFSVHMPETL